MERTWALMAEGFRHAPDSRVDPSLYQFATKVKKRGWTSPLLREFEDAVRPYIRPKRPWQRGSKPPFGPEEHLADARAVEFEVEFPPEDAVQLEIPGEKLPTVFSILRRSLERGSALLSDTGVRYWQTSSFLPEDRPGQRYLRGADAYFAWVKTLFDRLVSEHPDCAREEVRSWKDDRYFFGKFKIYAWMASDLCAPAEVGEGLVQLSSESFWDEHHRRELLHTLRSRWGSLSASWQRKIERRIIAGPPQWLNEPDADYRRRRAITAAKLFGWLLAQGCVLSARVQKILPKLRAADPNWRPSWDHAADHSYDGRSGYVKTQTDPAKILNAPISETVSLAQKHSGRLATADFTELAPFQGLVKERPFRALAALAFEARRKHYPVTFWRTILNQYPKDASKRLTCLLAYRIARLPQNLVLDLRYDIPRWTREHLARLAETSTDSALVIWDSLIDHFLEAGSTAMQSSIGEVSVAGEPQQRSRRTYEHAINSPMGQMAEVLFELLDRLDIGASGGIPDWFRARFTRLLSAPGEGSDNAICETGLRLRWLDYLDPQWVREFVIPLFKTPGPSAEPAWNGYLQDNELPNGRLFTLLKPDFLRVFSQIETWSWGDNSATRLYQFLVIACLWNRKSAAYVSYDEARSVLQQAGEPALSSAAWMLANIMRDHKGWKSFGRPFLLHAWPREAKFRTPDLSGHLATLAGEAGSHFPDVVRTILPLMGRVDHLDLFVHRMKKTEGAEGAELASRFPEAMLALLDRAVPDDPRTAPYDLQSVLGMIAEAEPRLRQDERWRRLHRIVTRA